MRDDSNQAEAATAFKGNLILFYYHIKRREVLTFQPTTGLVHKHFELCFSIIQLCIPLTHVYIPSKPFLSPVISSSLSSRLEKADTENSVMTVFIGRNDFSLRSRCLLSWDLTAVLQQWTGGILHCSQCNPNSHEHLQTACRHMRQQCSSMHRAIAMIQCWIGMAIQSTTVIMLGETHRLVFHRGLGPHSLPCSAWTSLLLRPHHCSEPCSPQGQA